jgi:anti-sigma factor RsiW
MNDAHCEDVRAVLPELVEEPDMSLSVRRHLSRCSECAGELEAYRSLRTATARLALATAAPPAGLKDALVAIPSQHSRLDEVRSHVARHRREYAAGVAIALGATGAALWRSRRRGLVTA